MNEENLGVVIDEIRRNRNFTVESLCDGIISPSTYFRFLSGKTSLSSESFMKLVFRLHMTFAMFLQDYQDFFRRKHHYAMLIHAKSYNDLTLIQDLIKDYRLLKESADWNNQDERFLMVATTLLGQMTQQPDGSLQLKAVQDHMKQLKSLTDNDFFALKLLMPYMALNDAEGLMRKHLKQLTNLQAPDLAGNLYYVCGILYVKHLKVGNKMRAAEYYHIMEEIYLDQLDLGWKLSQQLYQNIHLYFTGDQHQAIDQLNKLSVFYTELNLSHQSRLIEEICAELDIPHLKAKVTL